MLEARNQRRLALVDDVHARFSRHEPGFSEASFWAGRWTFAEGVVTLYKRSAN